MKDKRNALAELAEYLGEITSAWRPAEPTGQYATQSISYVRKASRIIAELAKVSDGEWNDVCNGHPAYFCTAGDMKVQCCVGKCRAIAEEGSKDEENNR